MGDRGGEPAAGRRPHRCQQDRVLDAEQAGQRGFDDGHGRFSQMMAIKAVGWERPRRAAAGRAIVERSRGSGRRRAPRPQFRHRLPNFPSPSLAANLLPKQHQIILT
jgi:hypothetical protein